MSQDTVKQALLATIAGINKDPLKAKVVFRAATRLEEDVRCSAQIRDFPSLVIDEPAALGGQDAGANPVELVLAALGTCQEILYSAYASVMDIPIDGVEITSRGYLDLRGLFGLDADIPPGYQRVSFDVDIRSSAPEADLRRLIDTVEAHCPVLDILTRSMPVQGKAKVNGRLLAELAGKAA
jgi:putative redox protein